MRAEAGPTTPRRAWIEWDWYFLWHHGRRRAFYKAVCKVTDREFEQVKTFAGHVVITESTLGNQEVAIAFKPREEWPMAFKFYKLYRT